MTELVNHIMDKVEELSRVNWDSVFEMTVLIGTFMFCIYAVSPIV